MNAEAIYESWVPPESDWSLWARPVLFAQMSDFPAEQNPRDDLLNVDVSWAPAAGEMVVLVIDLSGQESVQTGLALAGREFRPVPLFNACTGQHELIDQSPIIAALRAGAGYLASIKLAGTRPAFLLDDRRMKPRKGRPSDFDNRWIVFPQDFPSAAFLVARGLMRVADSARQQQTGGRCRSCASTVARRRDQNRSAGSFEYSLAEAHHGESSESLSVGVAASAGDGRPVAKPSWRLRKTRP